MKSWRLAVVAVLVVMALVLLFPVSEWTYEFDTVNLRMRSCSRTRLWSVGVLVHERCGEMEEHPTAERLRELGVLRAVLPGEQRWELIKGFKPGVRGWHGEGRRYIQVLGPTSFGTPVTYPTRGDLSQNLWVRWAMNKPEAAKQFWQQFQEDAAHRPRGDFYLYLAAEYVARNSFAPSAEEVDTYARRVFERAP